MTPNPADWLAARSPDDLLRAIRPAIPPGVGASQVTDADLPPALHRRLRLFGAACARQAWDLLPTDLRSAVLVSERFADGRAAPEDLRAVAIRLHSGPVTAAQAAHNAAGWAVGGYFPWGRRDGDLPWFDPGEAARAAARALTTRLVGPALPNASPAWHARWSATYATVRAEQADLVRDLFPLPGRTLPTAHPDWLTSAVRGLAAAMYEARDFAGMPVLADALQDAGCDDDAVLGHCRARCPHARGCWVVDLVRGP